MVRRRGRKARWRRGAVGRFCDHGAAGVREEFELRQQSAVTKRPADRQRPHDLRRGSSGRGQLGLDERRAAQRQPRLLSPLLQKLFAHGRRDAVRPVRQRTVSAPFVSPIGPTVTPDRFQQITEKYSRLRIGIAGDFCLDRYLEIDPSKKEISIETGLPVHNVVNVRSQPGAAGTILNNLVALGVGTITPVGFCGEDGEGYELRRALKAPRGVCLDYFEQTSQRRTFTYCKPLVIEPGKSPRELNRLDSKNWSPTPREVRHKLIDLAASAARDSDGMIVMDQVDVAETGVVTSDFLEALPRIAEASPNLLILADSRRGLRGFNKVSLKMNCTELSSLADSSASLDLTDVNRMASDLSRRQGRSVFVTLAERGIVGASPSGEVEHVPSFPVHGEIDIVGAGDAVTANLTAALAAGGTMRESLEIAMAAASIVIHQLGT